MTKVEPLKGMFLIRKGRRQEKTLECCAKLEMEKGVFIGRFRVGPGMEILLGQLFPIIEWPAFMDSALVIKAENGSYRVGNYEIHRIK